MQKDNKPSSEPATLILVGGFVGSGKTTYAKQLESLKQAIRFSMDEWMIALYGEHMERQVFDARQLALQEQFKTVALKLLAQGVCVIFDFGFWTKKERQAFTEWADDHEINSELHFLTTQFEVCKQRAINRNTQNLSDSYHMTEDMLDLFWSWFEMPSDNEVTKWVAS